MSAHRSLETAACWIGWLFIYSRACFSRKDERRAKALREVVSVVGPPASQHKVLRVPRPARTRLDHYLLYLAPPGPTTPCGTSIYCSLLARLAFKQVVARSSRARLISQPVVQLGTLITSPCGSRRRSVKCSIATT